MRGRAEYDEITDRKDKMKIEHSLESSALGKLSIIPPTSITISCSPKRETILLLAGPSAFICMV